MSHKPELTQKYKELPNYDTEEFRHIYLDEKKSEYYISNFGKAFSKKKDKIKYLTPHYDGKYYNIRLCIKGKVYTYKLHRVVAIAFIPTDDISLEVNHINGNKLDNSVENLEWVSSSDNCIKAVLTGLKPKTMTLSIETVRKYVN